MCQTFHLIASLNFVFITTLNFSESFAVSRSMNLNNGVRWMKANNREELFVAIQNNPQMIECDIIFYNKTVLVGSYVDSDLLFEEWLHQVLKHNFGLYITFYETSVVEPALNILQKFKKEIGDGRSFWISGNILPINNPEAVNLSQLIKSKTLFYKNRPNLSLGWITFPNATTYFWKDILDMIQLVDKYKNQVNVNFKFKYFLIQSSKAQIQFLLDIFPNCTITIIWINPNETLDINDFLEAVVELDQNRILYNLPKEIIQKKNEINKISIKSKTIITDLWQIKKSSTTFIGSETIIVPLDNGKITSKLKYGKSSNRSFAIEGKLSTFGFIGPTIMKITFLDNKKNPFLTCFFSNNISGGCLPEWIERNSTHVHDSCFIFQILIHDMGVNSTIVNNVRFDACSIDREDEISTFITTRTSNPNNSKAIVISDISYHHESSVLGDLINFFEGVSINIAVQPKTGFVVYEGIRIIGNNSPNLQVFLNYSLTILNGIMNFLFSFYFLSVY